MDNKYLCEVDDDLVYIKHIKTKMFFRYRYHSTAQARTVMTRLNEEVEDTNMKTNHVHTRSHCITAGPVNR